MLQNRGYRALNGAISLELHTKHEFLKMQINNFFFFFFLNAPIFLGSYLQRMFIEYSEEYT